MEFLSPCLSIYGLLIVEPSLLFLLVEFGWLLCYFPVHFGMHASIRISVLWNLAVWHGPEASESIDLGG